MKPPITSNFYKNPNLIAWPTILKNTIKKQTVLAFLFLFLISMYFVKARIRFQLRLQWIRIRKTGQN